MLFLQSGFEQAVRTRLGVNMSELPDSEINNKYISDYSEAIVLKRVPNYGDITDPLDKMYLETSIIDYICALLCPSMARRVNIDVQTLDVQWKKDRVKWDVLADTFMSDMEKALSQITTVSVVGIGNYLTGGRANFIGGL